MIGPGSKPKLRVGLPLPVVIWLALLVVFAREYLVLNHRIHGASMLSVLQTDFHLFKSYTSSPDPGGDLSLILGWTGFFFICLTNLYIIRKRLRFLDGKGPVRTWLDWHIFFGLLGPTMIVFHTNFHVRGLVAISFWSMMISVVSGIAGRYIYTQMLKGRADLKDQLRQLSSALEKAAVRINPTIQEAELDAMRQTAFTFAGGSFAITRGQATLTQVVLASVIGDLRLLTQRLPLPSTFGGVRDAFKAYGLLKRRVVSATYFRRLMGYWHTFHTPFAVFMYVVTIIHIAAALTFQVKH